MENLFEILENIKSELQGIEKFYPERLEEKEKKDMEMLLNGILQKLEDM